MGRKFFKKFDGKQHDDKPSAQAGSKSQQYEHDSGSMDRVVAIVVDAFHVSIKSELKRETLDYVKRLVRCTIMNETGANVLFPQDSLHIFYPEPVDALDGWLIGTELMTETARLLSQLKDDGWVANKLPMTNGPGRPSVVQNHPGVEKLCNRLCLPDHFDPDPEMHDDERISITDLVFVGVDGPLLQHMCGPARHGVTRWIMTPQKADVSTDLHEWGRRTNRHVLLPVNIESVIASLEAEASAKRESTRTSRLRLRESVSRSGRDDSDPPSKEDSGVMDARGPPPAYAVAVKETNAAETNKKQAKEAPAKDVATTGKGPNAIVCRDSTFWAQLTAKNVTEGSAAWNQAFNAIKESAKSDKKRNADIEEMLGHGIERCWATHASTRVLCELLSPVPRGSTTRVFKTIQPLVSQCAKNERGWRVLVASFHGLQDPDAVTGLMRLLGQDIITFAEHPHGSKALVEAFENATTHAKRHLYDPLQTRGGKLVTSESGCAVLRTAIDCGAKPMQKQLPAIIADILRDPKPLMYNPHSASVLVSIFNSKAPVESESQTKILQELLDVVRTSQHDNTSKVMLSILRNHDVYPIAEALGNKIVDKLVLVSHEGRASGFLNAVFEVPHMTERLEGVVLADPSAFTNHNLSSDMLRNYIEKHPSRNSFVSQLATKCAPQAARFAVQKYCSFLLNAFLRHAEQSVKLEMCDAVLTMPAAEEIMRNKNGCQVLPTAIELIPTFKEKQDELNAKLLAILPKMVEIATSGGTTAAVVRVLRYGSPEARDIAAKLVLEVQDKITGPLKRRAVLLSNKHQAKANGAAPAADDGEESEEEAEEAEVQESDSKAHNGTATPESDAPADTSSAVENAEVVEAAAAVTEE